MPEFHMIFARKINTIPEFYMIYARKKLTKCPNFYTIFARKIFFPIFFLGGGGGKLPPSPTPMLRTWQIFSGPCQDLVDSKSWRRHCGQYLRYFWTDFDAVFAKNSQKNLAIYWAIGRTANHSAS